MKITTTTGQLSNANRTAIRKILNAGATRAQFGATRYRIINVGPDFYEVHTETGGTRQMAEAIIKTGTTREKYPV